jgi:phage I-like protein
VDLSGAGQEARRIIPAGTFSAPRGAMAGSGPWVLDKVSAELLIARTRNRSTDIVVDYEHQTLLAETNGKPAPASGWLKPGSLEWREDGLYGVIEWTDTAAAAIAANEYRYLSPVFTYDPTTRHPLDLLQIALTNTPAIDGGGVLALAAARAALSQPDATAPETSSQSREDDPMDIKKIVEALGLKEDADEEAVLETVAALRKDTDALAALRKELDLAEDGDAKEAIAALKTGATAAADTVPRRVFDEMSSQLAALKSGNDQAQKDQLIKDGLADGRIPGQATAEWLKGFDLAALKKHLDDAQPLAALKSFQTGGKAPDEKAGDGKDNDKLSEAELAVCKNMNLSPEDFRKANA